VSVPTKVLSLRIPASLAEDVAAVAFAEGLSVSRCIREAVEHHVASRRSDPDFEERIKGRIKKREEEDRELLERLGAK
jgi:predicted DNA-binding protein